MSDFDIREHDFSDGTIIDITKELDYLHIQMNDEYMEFTVDKNDAIALAKHFKLTQEDL
tara:strand:+ start:60460 stop:60636 length:177 start_codon:yes stop_codon:yes gene_type:complete